MMLGMNLRKSWVSVLINWKDCIVPEKPFNRNDIYVWIAYQKHKPHLPIAIADSSRELAQKIGVDASTVRSCWEKYQSKKCKNTRYHRIKVGIIEEVL